MVGNQVTKKGFLSRRPNGRSYYRTYEASPIYSFKNTSSLATETELLFDFAEDDPTTEKYLPFNTMQVTNLSNSDIYLYINQDRTKAKIVPAGAIITFTKTEIPAIRSIIVYNSSSTNTISANEVEIAPYKEAVTQERFFQEMHKAFFRFFRGGFNG